MPTIPNIIEIANISLYLCNDKHMVNNFYKGGTKTQTYLPERIYMVKKGVEWMYSQNPSYSSLQETANYLYTLCNKYVFEATQISGQGGGGTVISPTTSIGIANPLRITSSDFASATTWNDSRIDSSWTLQVFWNDNQRFLQSDEWVRTSTGINITISGFNSASATYTFYIFISQ